MIALMTPLTLMTSVAQAESRGRTVVAFTDVLDTCIVHFSETFLTTVTLDQSIFFTVGICGREAILTLTLILLTHRFGKIRREAFVACFALSASVLGALWASRRLPIVADTDMFSTRSALAPITIIAARADLLAIVQTTICRTRSSSVHAFADVGRTELDVL
jgi:hypothetical protein